MASTKIKIKTSSIETKLNFLEEILTNLVSLRNSYDLRTQILIGISSTVFLLSIKNVFDNGGFGLIGFLIIAIASLLSCILCMFSLRPPNFFMDRSQLNRTLFHHTRTASMSAADFQKQLYKIINSEKEIIDEYSKHIYNISVIITTRKKFFINQAAHVLTVGLTLGFIIMFFLP